MLTIKLLLIAMIIIILVIMALIHGVVNSAREFIYEDRPHSGGVDISFFAYEQSSTKSDNKPTPTPHELTPLFPPDEKSYPENPKFDTRFKGGTLSMTMRPVTGMESIATWQAEMDFYVKDMASLMLGGLHWSEANVEKAGGCILVPSDKLPNLPQSLGWLYGRRYVLKDLGHEPKWRATLWIYGRDCSELSRMKLGDLSVDQVRRAKATHPEFDEIYGFDVAQGFGYNGLFGRRPLQGWWPWPKEELVRPLGFDCAAIARIVNEQAGSRVDGKQ
ncbi:unnamed protein product [Clonostachys rosea]|uniref:Uncharacterized protein n=1 Tax=Bionectria ochroleuca TaxID=29856 RepID=A0ABY6UJT2_BIOOC|nr:unnamed protein product [Clonostachys rosea]